jgi:hypothetical protein
MANDFPIRVGGVVSETNMKFFIQFSSYGFLFCCNIFIVMLWAVVTRSRDVRNIASDELAFLTQITGF